jgi:Tol biopolymer transport system component
MSDGRRAMKRSGPSDFVVRKGALQFLPRNSKTAEAYAGSAVKLKVLVVLSISILLLSCHNNPVYSGGGFPVKAGPILFISDKSGTDQLYSMSQDGSNVQHLTSDSTFPILDAKWSPDGSKIAVVSLIGDEMTYPSFRDAIFVMNADGTDMYQLTKQWVHVNDSTYGHLEYGGATGPVWSPDSRQIAYSRLMVPEALAHQDVFINSLDGNNEQRITSRMSSGEKVVDWSPDGQLLLVNMIDWSKTDSRIVVAIFSVDGYMQRQISSDVVTSNGGAWRPDQKYIAFTSWSGTRHEVIQCDSTGDNRSLIATTNHIFNYVVCWSPVGDEILLNSTDGESSVGTVWQVSAKSFPTGSLRVLSPFRDSAISVYATSWRR